MVCIVNKRKHRYGASALRVFFSHKSLATEKKKREKKITVYNTKAYKPNTDEREQWNKSIQ